VLDLEGSGLARGAVLGHDAEGAAAERMEGIDDIDGQRRPVLTLLTARGIKKIPRLTAFPDWSRSASARTS
jgi:hypothetical protein